MPESESPKSDTSTTKASPSSQAVADNTSPRDLVDDSMRRALSTLWPLGHSRSRKFEIMYELQWELRYTLGQYLTKDQCLGDVLSITRGSFNAQAQSCRDYLSWRWLSVSPPILKGLEEILALNTEG